MTLVTPMLLQYYYNYNIIRLIAVDFLLQKMRFQLSHAAIFPSLRCKCTIFRSSWLTCSHYVVSCDDFICAGKLLDYNKLAVGPAAGCTCDQQYNSDGTLASCHWKEKKLSCSNVLFSQIDVSLNCQCSSHCG